MKFEPDDFHSHQCPPLGDNPRTYARLAEFVNLRIEEMLKEAPVVECDHPGNLEDCAWLAPGNLLRPVHTARLVDIKPIEESGK